MIDMKKILTRMFLIGITALVLMQCKDDDITAPAPQDVTGLRAEAGLGYVILTWALPANATVGEYMLTYSPEGVPVTIEGNQVTYTVSKLGAGIKYTFTIKTKNADGKMSAGATVEATTLKDGTIPDTHFTGNLQMVLQSDLEAFDSKYTYIDGDVVITGPDITDLSRLANIDSISGKLEIFFNDGLQSLAAFGKLRYVGNNLYIRANVKVPNLDAFSKLEFVGRDLSVLGMPLIENLNGFSSLKNVDGSIYIGTEAWKTPPNPRPNVALGNFCGIKNLLVGGGLKGEIYIANNKTNPTRLDIANGSCENSTALPEVANLSVSGGDAKVTLAWTASTDAAVTGYELTWSPGGATPVAIAKDLATYAVTGLTNGTEYTFVLKTKGNNNASSQGVTLVATPSAAEHVYTGNLNIATQAQLDALPEYYTAISGALHLEGEDITDLSKLANLKTVSNKLEIVNCTSLTSVQAFSNLTSVGHNFYIYNNPLLTSLEGFHNVVTITRDITFLKMTGLTNLDGLRALTTGRNLYIGVEGWLANPPADKGNTALNNLCGIKLLLQGSGLTGALFIANNASNLTKDQILTQCP